MIKKNHLKVKIQKNSSSLKSAGILFVIYFVFSYFVDKDIFRTVDYNIMVFLQEKLSRILDIPFSLFSIAGSTEVTLLICSLIFIYLIVRKKQLFLGISLFFLIPVIELMGKFTIYHPKPPNIFFRYSLDLHLPSAFIIDTHFSYPSGHMARTTFVIVLFLFLILLEKDNKYMRRISLILTGLFMIGMFISRIYLGEHWITDTVGGVLLGGGIGMLALFFRNETV